MIISKSPFLTHKKRSKKLIKSTVTIHDRTQIEAVFDYYLFRGATKDPTQNGTLRYKVDAYLFYPRQCGINSATYPKFEFYNDIRPLIRFREPKIGFKQLLGKKENAPSPITFLQHYVAEALSGSPPVSLTEAIAESRLLACIFVSTILRNIDRWRKRWVSVKAQKPSPDIAAIADCFWKMCNLIEKIELTYDEIRTLRDSAKDLPDAKYVTLKTELKLVDEYLCYRMRDAISYLLTYSDPWRRDMSILEIATFSAKTQTFLSYLEAHTNKQGFIKVDERSSLFQKAIYLKRRGELKRRLWGILFLKLRTTPIFTMQQQFAPMIAAALAALWATGAQIIFIDRLIDSQGQGHLLQLSGMTILLTGMLAYIVKDRIKEIVRNLLTGHLFRRLPDHSERIFYDVREGSSNAVGRLLEFTRFIKYDQIPSKIARIRSKCGTLESLEHDQWDQFLHYSKEVDLKDSIKIQNRYSLRVVHDILRLNIDVCLPRLAEPLRHLPIVDMHGNVKNIDFPKIYYLDLALSYSQINAKKVEYEKNIQYFRLTIDKNGLRQLDRLDTDPQGQNESPHLSDLDPSS